MASDGKSKNSSPSSDLRSNGIYLFASRVDEESCADCSEFIIEANLENDITYNHITLIINSQGGSITDGFSLIDVIQGSRLPVYTVGIGLLASMGLLIFMSGKKGRRILTPRTLVLSHQWWSVNYGKEHELIASRKHNELISGMVMDHYKKCSSLKKDKDIRKVLLPPEDVWLGAEEALKFGLCDEVKDLSGGYVFN